jgi:hypothetical protein
MSVMSKLPTSSTSRKREGKVTYQDHSCLSMESVEFRCQSKDRMGERGRKIRMELSQ